MAFIAPPPDQSIASRSNMFIPKKQPKVERLSQTILPTDQSQVVRYRMYDEDHTFGQLIRYSLVEDTQRVRSAMYHLPHPLEPFLHLFLHVEPTKNKDDQSAADDVLIDHCRSRIEQLRQLRLGDAAAAAAVTARGSRS